MLEHLLKTKYKVTFVIWENVLPTFVNHLEPAQLNYLAANVNNLY